MRAGKLITAAALFLAAAILPAAAASCESSADYGAILLPEDIINGVKALPPEAISGKSGKKSQVKLPSRMMLSNLPPIAQQGTAQQPGVPGTCEAQSFGYGLGSYTAARDAAGKIRWDASYPQNNTSSAYLYTLIHSREGRKCPEGSKGVDYLAQLTAYGAASRGQVPYQPNCTYLDGININYDFPSMDRFRIGSYAVIPVAGNPSAVDQIKSHLNAGQAVAFTGSVLCGYALTPKFESGVIYETQTIAGSGHGQLLVGYDDKVGKSGAKGGLLVQNSFGTSWPPSSAGSIAPPGMAYWSYNSFAVTQGLAAVAYPLSTSPGSTRLSASPFSAPLASLNRAWQWTPADGGSAYLIMPHVFAEPVLLNSVALKEPGGTGITATAAYGQNIASGYSYLKRSDGKSFLSGTYKVKLRATTLGGTQVTYTGQIKVKKLKGSSLAPTSMQGVQITGSTGANAILTGP